MKKNKLISAVLCVCLLASFILCMPVYSEDEITSGKFGDNITWTLNNGVLTLSGNGSTYDFDSDITSPSLPFRERSATVSVVIEEGVTRIGKNAFNGFYNLSDISFAKSVEEIAEHAFKDTNCKTVSFPEESSLKKISPYAFSHIFSLVDVDLSNCNQLYEIGESAFFDSQQVTYITFPQNGVLEIIGDSAFKKCTNVIRLYIPKTVKTIGEEAFAQCGAMLTAEIPESVTKIADRAFANTTAVIFGTSGSEAERAAKAHSLRFAEGDSSQKIVIRQGTVSDTVSWKFDTTGTLEISGTGYIGDFPSSLSTPWYNCSASLTNLVIGEGITGIGRENFANMERLKTATLPSTIKNIGEYAFMGCRSLETINLPEGLETISSHAFYYCRSLKAFDIPSTLYFINGWALYYLESLEKFTVAEGNTAFSTDEYGALYDKNKTHLMVYPVSASSKTYVIPDSVTIIDPYTFNDSKYLEEIVFGDNSAITALDHNTFADCSIKSITLPKGLKVIGAAAFSGCKNLDRVVFPDSLESIDEGAFRWTGISTLELPASIRVIGNSAFYGCKNLVDVVLPEGLTTIGAFAFLSCENLESIHLPATLSWLDPSVASYYSEKLSKISVSPYNPYYATDEIGALYRNKNELLWYPARCENTSYVIPEGTEKIHPSAFLGATSLEEVTIPKTVTVIPSSAFQGCSALKKIDLHNGITLIDSSAFSYCSKLKEVNFEEGSTLKTVGTRAFMHCTSLKEFSLPDSVGMIGHYAFTGCTLLESFYVGEGTSLAIMGTYPFSGCPFINIFAPDESVAAKHAEEFCINKRITVKLDGEAIEFDVFPTIKSSRTLVPLRAVFEALGASVEWNDETKTAVATKDSVKISVTVDNNIMTVDGKEVELDCPATIIADRTLVPVRAISEAFGYEVSWDGTDRTVDIVSK